MKISLISFQINFPKKIKIIGERMKKNLVFMQNGKGDILRYSNREHLRKTKRLEYSEKLNKLKDKLKISTEETSETSTNPEPKAVVA